jgi:hypothetical protein
MVALLLGDYQFGTPTIAEQVVVVGECIRRYFGITVAHAQRDILVAVIQSEVVMGCHG